MVCAIFYTHQTSGAYAGVWAFNCTHQMEKTDDVKPIVAKLFQIFNLQNSWIKGL